MTGRGNKKISSKSTDRKWYVGVYTRRSFDDNEDEESDTITNQKDIISSFINNESNMIIVDYYTDDGYTGTNFNRPGFQRMIQDICKKRINTIIVKDLSRLGREYLGVGKYLEQFFPIYELRIISINDGLDSYLRPEGIHDLIVPLKNIMNENYAKDISIKVSSAYKIMAQNGKYVSGTPPYGYDIDPNDKHHLVINKSESEIVKRIFDMALNGDGRIKICKYLNENKILCRTEIQRRKKAKLSLIPDDEQINHFWGTTTIGRLLSNEVYIGNLVQLKTTNKSFKDKTIVYKNKNDWIRFDNTHEAIIDKDIFDKVQINIKSNTKEKSPIKIYSIYNTKLKCNSCKKAMIRQDDHRGNREISNYFCMNYLRNGTNCSPHKIKASDLDRMVLEAIQMQVKLVIELDKSLKKLYFKRNKESNEEEYKKNIRLIDYKLDNLKTKKRQSYENWKFGEINKSEFLKLSKEIDEQEKNLNESRKLYESTYQENVKRIRKYDYWIDHYKRNRKIKKITKEVLDELIKIIYVNSDGNIRIIFRYQDEFTELLHYLEEGKSALCQNGELVSM